MKQFNFDLTVSANALNCPNPADWYDKAYLGSNVAGNFRIIPGVKNSTKVSNNVFSPVLVAADCAFNATASVLSAKTMSVCDVKANLSICKKDIESSFVSEQMAKGSQSYDVASFMSHYWDTLQKEIVHEIEGIRWRGNTTNNAFTGASSYLKLCDGYEKVLTATTGVVAVTLTAITVSNVVAALTAVIQAAPATVKGLPKQDLRFYVASNVFLAFQIASSNFFLATPSTSLVFAGIQIVEQPGMSDSKIVFGSKDNFVYLLDGEGDEGDLVAIDALKTLGIPSIYTVAMMKIGFDILNPTEIVYYS